MADGYLIGENLRRHLGALIRRGDSLPEYSQNKRQPIESFHAPSQRPPGYVTVENQTGHAIPVGGVVRIGEPRFDSEQLCNGTYDGTDEASSLVRKMSLNQKYVGRLPTLDDAIGIAMEPIAIGGRGRVAIRGAVYFRLRVVNVLHRYAAPLAGDWTQLKSAGCGPVKILAADARLGDGRNAWGVM